MTQDPVRAEALGNGVQALAGEELTEDAPHHIAILDAQWQEIVFQATNDPSLAPFTEAFDLMGDGSMMVLPTPGHMPGAVSMLVRRGDTPPLLLGDLTYAEELLERDQTPAPATPSCCGRASPM